ncbi:MAG: leucine--tRNA ligase [Phycisphaeraceae bacterium]|nr:MAG: leucine--tRNA ligase [Phycisphaeraceae bacterium]
MSDAATPSPSRTPDSGPAHRYTAALAEAIETRWQTWWDENRTFVQPNPGDPGFDGSRPKFYCLDMFPYPSGAGLHVGHPEGYTATDIICRYRRMKGFNVLHPMGWDAYGLPAEQYAIQTGVHPAITTRRAIDTFRRQLKRFGFSYDWTREFATIDEDYYRWTQWIFLRLYNAWYDEELRTARSIDDLIAEFRAGTRPLRYNPKAAEYAHAPGVTANTIAGPWDSVDYETRRSIVDSYRLAYVSEQLVNWCPKLGTALANEEVIDGRSERGGYPVVRKPLRQWMMRITAYADRLIDDLTGLDWPDSTRTQQAEWIGRSEGAEIDFPLLDPDKSITRTLRVYTTRPDTIFGATYMVIAPEHPLVASALEECRPETDIPAVEAYIARAKARTDVDRQADTKTKTGVFSGIMAVNPATGKEIPVWIADYVLMGYGHGAIMAVPAHDERDFEFARQFNLPIRDVVLSRIHWAMAYFANNATDDERNGDTWSTHLADFLGLVTSTNAEPDHMPALLARVRAARPAVGAAGGAGGEAASGDAGVGKRGSTQGEWLETIASMGFASFDDLRTAFAEGTIVERFGIAYSGAGHAINSANAEVSLDGLSTPDAKQRIIAWLDSKGIGRKKINYKLRDWLFSRQRYWGEPFPIVYDERGFHFPVDESKLPVTLPPLEDFKPEESEDPQPLLAKAKEWMRATAKDVGVKDLPADAIVRRETNTMPGWAGSCWYYLRYCDAKNDKRLIGKPAESYWMTGRVATSDDTPIPRPIGGVDLYIGGNEHAVLHLLYARFWHKVLFDLGEVSTPEPFQKLFHQGLITSYAYQRADKGLVAVDMVDNKGTEEKPRYIARDTGEEVTQITAKMSKSLKNVVNPDDVIADYGADTFRLYEMYMGPLEASKPWNTRDITGLFRFLQRLWRLTVNEETGDLRLAPDTSAGSDAHKSIEKLLHRTTVKVEQAIEKLSFNTGIAALIEFVNAATSSVGAENGPGLTRPQLERLALILCPFAPHIAEELWSKLGHTSACSLAPWPAVDESMLRDSEVELPVQVQGKVRARITVPADADDASVTAVALAEPKVAELLSGKPPKKVIVVKGRMVNVVV